MGKKGGGGPPSGRFILLSRFILLQRIESCKLNTGILSIDQIVESLRTTFPDYRRMKQQPFTKYVFQTLEQKRPKSRKNESDEDEDEDHKPQISPIRSPVRKKVRKSDLDEERLAKKHSTSSSSSYSSDDGAVSTSSSSSYSSDDGAVSTSEDASFEVPFEPDIDLTKSLLRSSYGGVSQPVATEKNVELETVKKGRKIDSADVVRAEKNLADKRRKDFKGSSGTRVTENEGPMFRDIGGIKGVLDELMMEVIMPLKNPELPRWLGVKPMSGVLLHGPPGCGKTKLAHAIANETRVPFYKISATEVVSGVSGASEENIRDLFSKAYRTAPSIVFIDEIDAIASKRENLHREMERRIVTQLMTCMDESHQTICQSADVDSNLEVSEKRPGYVLVIGATNRPDAVDPALRRPGRFDQEIALGVPDENARIEILSVVMRNLRLEGSFDMKKIARSTPGFVGADLAALANKAGNLAMKRILFERKFVVHRELKYMDGNEEWLKCSWDPEEMERLSITMADFEEAIKVVRPSSRREGFSTIPNVKWEDVGGLHSLRKEFDEYIIMRIKYPEDYEEFGVDLETGFMLYGPPGCGKTLIAKAVANEAGANFIHIKGPELLNKYVGESELAVRTIFSRARTCAPCVLFFDEMDAITSERGKDGGWVIERLLNQLLIELDGADQRRGVYVIGATNRLEVVDRAVLRPGRLGKLLYVPVPSPDDRGLILKAIAREKPLAADVDLDAIGRSAACENLSGADLAAVVNEAAMAALREKRMAISEGTSRTEPWEIKASHFELGVKKISPSVSAEQRRHYEVKFGNITMA